MYKINGDLLEEVSEVRDLGVILDGRLSFTSHVDSVVKRAAQTMGFIKRNSKGFKCHTKIVLFNSLCRSILEFASVVWNC